MPSADPLKRAASRKSWYGRNKKRHLANVAVRNAEQRALALGNIRAFLSANPCVDCREGDLRVLEFDHVRGEKLNSVALMVGRGYSWYRISAEIAKCEVRCANCHRKKTHAQLGWTSRTE